MNKSKKHIIIGLIGVAFIIGLITLGFFSGLIKLKSQQVYGSFSTKAECISYVKDYLCTEGYLCYDCKIQSLTNKYGADCYFGAGSVPSASNICASASMVTSHSRYACYSGSVYWFDSTGKREEIKTSCTNGCVDTSLTQASCKSASATLYGVTACKSLYNLNCPNGCYIDATKCADGSSGIIKTLYGVTACKGIYKLDCPNGCYNGDGCADGTPGKVVTPVPVQPSCGTGYHLTTDCVTYTCGSQGSACAKDADNSDDAVVDRGSFDCSSVSCPDYCDSSGTSFSGGSCQSDLGGCVYNSVSTNSPTCVQSGSSCKVYTIQDGTPCGTDKVWVSGADSVGCTTFSCMDSGSGIVPLKGVPPIFWYILGGFILLILIVVIVVVSKKKSKR